MAYKRGPIGLVTVEDFVRIWQTSDSVDAVVAKLEELGVKYKSRTVVVNKATKLRTRGVPLKNFSAHWAIEKGGGFDRLKKLAKELVSGDVS